MIIGLMMTKNEAGRWIEDVLRELAKICGKIVVLDDGSTDGTREICARYAEVHRLEQREESEAPKRKRAWALATKEAMEGDWIFCLDADEIPVGIERLPEMIRYAERNGYIDAIAFRLYDMWSETHYRSDELWNAHERPWVLCVRYDTKREYRWREQKLHGGRFPINASEENVLFVSDIRIKHMGWSREKERREKYERYMAADPDGKYGVLAQYESILDERPNLVRYET